MADNDLGIDVPASTDVFDPDGDMRAMGDSFAGRIIVPVANTTERDALATTLSPSSSEPLYVHRADAPAPQRLEWTEDGTTWHTPGGNPSAAGSGTTPAIAAINTTYTKAITFPTGRFSVAPIVNARTDLILSPPANTHMWVDSVTTAGANVNIRRSVTSAAVDFTWIAVEPDA
jgi:hypothetical protein